MRSTVRTLAASAAVLALSPARAQDVEPTPPAPEAPWWSGTLDSRVVSRSRGSDSDLDVYTLLSLDAGREGAEWSGRATARLAWDVDGRSEGFESLADAEGDALDSELYDAFVRWRGSGEVRSATLGRQFVHETPVALWFDGLALESREAGAWRWKTSLHGGVPVHAFESSRSGDSVVGIAQELRPLKPLRVRADWLHLEDERSGFDGSNDLAALALDGTLGPGRTWKLAYSRLDGEDRDASASLAWADYERGWTLQLSHYRLLETQTARALELDPFFEQLNRLEPFSQTRAVATRDFTPSVHATGGVDLRRIEDSDDEGSFNHDFDRYWLTLALDDALPFGVALALTGEVWSSASDVETWGVDLDRRLGERWRVAAGSFYSLFKLDSFAGSEREDVRTSFARIEYRSSETARWSLRYEREDDDSGDTHTLRGGVSWRF